jgi:hypothetical protein
MNGYLRDHEEDWRRGVPYDMTEEATLHNRTEHRERQL